MSIIPGAVTSDLVERVAFGKIINARTRSATIHSATVDDGNTPTTQLRRGLIVGKRSDGKFINAEAASVVAHTKSRVDSLEAPDGDWASETLTVSVEGLGSVTFTMDSGITNLATFLADFNASNASVFATASNDGSGKARITANKAGVAISVQSSLAGAFNADADTDTSDSSGALTEYGCLQDPIPDMTVNGTATDHQATILTRDFDLLSVDVEADNLTIAAREYFEANNVKLVSA